MGPGFLDLSSFDLGASAIKKGIVMGFNDFAGSTIRVGRWKLWMREYLFYFVTIYSIIAEG